MTVITEAIAFGTKLVPAALVLFAAAPVFAHGDHPELAGGAHQAVHFLDNPASLYGLGVVGIVSIGLMLMRRRTS